MQKRIKRFFSGDLRSVKAKKNIIGSFILKGISIVISLLLVPLTIDYLNPASYGVWLTLASIIAWFNFFDIGLGNGLRNKFAIAKAKGDFKLARIYISTTYAIISIIAIALFLVFILINQFLNWDNILNTPEEIEDLRKLVFIVFTVFCLQFVTKLINVIFIADQRPMVSTAINTTASFISLLAVYFLINSTEESLLYLGASMSLINLLVPLIVSFWAFKGQYKDYKPSIKLVNLAYAKDLFGIGMKFFVIQIATLIVFATDNVIIAHVVGPEDVTRYNIAHKYFGIVTIIFTIITTPYWSAFTDAYYKNDFTWIKRVVKQVSKLWVLLSIFTVAMFLFSDAFYNLWIGDRVEIPSSMSFVFALYVIVISGGSILGNFVNGSGKLTLSLYYSVFVGIINIPLSIFLARNCGLGATGVILATLLGAVPRVILHIIQYVKLMNRTATGIWNK